MGGPAMPENAPRIRTATPGDLPALLALEAASFQDYRRASAASLRRSLESPRQSVWVVDGPRGQLGGLLVLWHFPHRIRIYDIATHPDLRGQGIGKALLQHAEAQARAAGCSWMTLEAEEADPDLVAWYRHHGYAVVDRLPDFYHAGCHAVRMTKRL
ncbi:MAG TPA: N-acetyltransferase, partial [Candidatus Thermoplasmatota archaeon]|nr:N-acetyltransferase [Candidatus Thermoplasmatota archaeon]